MQNNREIINNLIRKKSTGRIGLFDAPWEETLEKWVKEEGYPVDEDGNPVRPYKHFKFDMNWAGGWFDEMPIAGVDEIVEETKDWVIKKDGIGAISKHWKNRTAPPGHISYALTSRKVWEQDYRDHLLNPNRSRLNIEQARVNVERLKAEGVWSFYGHIFIWEIMRKSVGEIYMFEALMTDKEWIHDFNRVYTDFFMDHYRILFEEAGLPDGIWVYEDIAYKNGLFCSPAMLEELIFPYYKELVSFFHSYDLPVIFHSDGNINQALPLIVDAGFDALNPMDTKAGCDVVQIAEKYSDQLAFIGGLDARILESGDKDFIKKETIKLIEKMESIGARWLFGSDHSIPPTVTYDSFSYAVEVYRKHIMNQEAKIVQSKKIPIKLVEIKAKKHRMKRSPK